MMKIVLQDISKYYGNLAANKGISLTVEPGTVHGILGENGAGKSTLMKILAGYISKTRGAIFINDAPAEYQTPARASALGIGMLYQDPLDFPQMSVLDNFMLGQHSKQNSRNSSKDLKNHLSDLSRCFKFDLNPNTPVKYLTVGQRQQLELLRLLSLGIRVLILDEPTTGISDIQKTILFEALKQLVSDGKSVILVSHKLEDAEALCDKVTVLRQGIVSGESDKPFHTGKLLKMMFGEEPTLPTCSCQMPGKTVLSMDSVYALGGRTGLRNCSLSIREREVVGLAGLEGSGQGLFLRLAAGVQSPVRGKIYVQDIRMNGKDYHSFKTARISFLPTSRLEEGLIPGLSVAEHFALQEDSGFFLTKRADAVRTAGKRIENFRVKGGPDSPVESLSGGNQQRLLLSFLSGNPILLLLENPTRGLDTASANWVWGHLKKYCENNTAIVFSSSELDEILAVSDRVLVFFEGKIVMDVKTSETTAQELGQAIAGKAKIEPPMNANKR